ELTQRGGPLAQDAALAVVEDPAERISRGRGAERAERSLTHDRLGVDRLPRSVDPALGEDRGGRRFALSAPGARDVEAPGREVRVERVDPDDGAVVAQRRDHVALEVPA